MPIEPHYTAADLANLLHLSRGTVYRLLRTDRIRWVRIGTVIRIPETAVVEYLDTAAVTATDIDRALAELHGDRHTPVCPRCARQPPAPGHDLCWTCTGALTRADRLDNAAAIADRHERRLASKRRWWATNGAAAKQRQREKRHTHTDREQAS